MSSSSDGESLAAASYSIYLAKFSVGRNVEMHFLRGLSVGFGLFSAWTFLTWSIAAGLNEGGTKRTVAVPIHIQVCICMWVLGFVPSW